MRLLHGLVLPFLARASAPVPQVGEVGLPLLRHVSPLEYDSEPQVFDAAQGPDGLLYFGCPQDFAVLRYDGERWRKWLLPVPPVSLDTDDTGCLWVGSSDDFGFLREGQGGMEFVSRSSAAVQREPRLLSFIQTLCTPRGVFFLSKEVLVLWDGKEERSWRASQDSGFMDVVALGDDVFVLDGVDGLLVLAEDELLESDALGPERVRFDTLGSDGECMVGVWLDAKGLHWIRSDQGCASTLVVPELLRGPTYLSDAVLTPEGTLVVSSASGVLLVDPLGHFEAWLDDDVGLPNSLAYSLFVDRDRAVWANLSFGLARIDPGSPVSLFGEELGLEGTPLAFARHAGSAYCGTFEGLFRLVGGERSRFERLEAVPSQPVFDLLSTRHGLLLVTELGLWLWDGSRATRLSEVQPLALERLSARVPPREEFVVVAGHDALQLLRWQDGPGWSLDASRPVGFGTDSMVSVEHGLWAHSYDRGLYRVPFDGSFGEPQRVAGEWLGIHAAPGGCLAWNREQLAYLRGPSLVPEPFGPAASLDWVELRGPARWTRPLVDEYGCLWLLDPRSLRRLGGSTHDRIRPEPDLVWTSPLALEGALFDELDRSVAWLNTHEGLVRVETAELEPPHAAAPLLWPMTRAGDGPWRRLPEDPLPADSSLRIEATAAAFDGTPTSYRYRLEGLERDWSEWTTAALKEYTTLPGGRYVLRVQSRKQGRILGESQRSFEVRSPWYARASVLVLGFALLGAGALGVARWRSARLRHENERLARLVAERMRELEAEKTRVLERSAELQHVNERLVKALEAHAAADRAQREMHARLEEAQRLESLGVLAAGIAHDFNNYLTSILGYAQMALEEHDERGELAGHLQNVTLISRQAAELCSGLLSLAGKTPPQALPLDLSRAVRDMEALLRTSLGDRGELRLDLAGELPSIAGDPSHLRRALVNLVINAAEASRGNRRPIVLRTGALHCTEADLRRMHRDGEREPGSYVFVEVEDEGIGMPSESMRHLFDPFFSTKLVGRGLGLATVFRIVSSHGGAIEVMSEVGRGTTVRLFFPEVRGPCRPPPERAPAPASSRLSGRVLVVDDEEQVRRVSTLFCRRLGLEVLAASSGREALARLARGEDPGERIDVVLLDLSMPGMDGLQVLAEIRRRHRELPVLLVSGYTDRLPSAPDGATRFLAKPYSIEAFSLAMREVLEGSPAAARGPR